MPRRLAHFSDPRLDAQVEELIKHSNATRDAADKHASRRDNPHNVQAQQVLYSSGVSGFTPATVKAALDALAGVRIVEMGSNANGKYVRWENGLQICAYRTTQNSTMLNTDYGTVTVGGITFYRADVTWQFPSTFNEVPAIFLSARVFALGGTPSEITVIRPYMSQSPDYALWSVLGDRAIATIRGASFFAIGRWK